jgi:hypothetical protein
MNYDGFTPICSQCKKEISLLKYFSPTQNKVYCNDSCAIAGIQETVPATAPGGMQFIGFGSHLTTLATAFNKEYVFHQTHQYITQLAVERVEADNGWPDFFSHLQEQNFIFPVSENQRRLSAHRLVSGNAWSEAPIRGGHRMNLLSRVSREKMQRVLDRYPVETAGIMVGDRFRYNMKTWPLVAAMVWQNGIYAVDKLVFRGALGCLIQYDYHFICPPELSDEALSATVTRSCTYLLHRFRQAVVHRDLFWLGCALHTIQDSYARGHAIRVLDPNNLKKPSTIVKVQRGTIFGDERDYHTREDSMRALVMDMDPRMRNELITGCAYLLILFHDTLLRQDQYQQEQQSERESVLAQSLLLLEKKCHSDIFSIQ